ncbi:MAG: hypothetical protein EAZ15_04640 [Sphingobacteriales bacterium]|nr:MAG: hypothetical protein EAZ15_04640 [Sphingobacteriales bacterium]
MKNLKINLLFLFALCGCFASCEKVGEQQSVFFPQTLYANQINKITEVRLFTQGKEITDADIITNFIKDETNFNLQNQAINTNEEIFFLSKSLAQFGNPKQTYDLNSDFSNRKTDFIFSSQKLITVNPQSLTYLLLKFKEPPIATGVAPNITYTTKDFKVAYGNYLDLDLSALSYKIKQGNSTPQIGIAYNLPITIDTKALDQLQITDTVALQYFTYNFKAR